MPYNIPPALLALAAQTNGQGQSPSGFGGSMANVLGTINQGQAAAGQRSDRQMQQMLQIAEMEQRVRAAEEQRAQQMQQQQAAQQKAAMEQQQAAELRQQLPPQLQQLFDVDQKAAIGQAFQDPTSLQQNLQAGGLQPGSPQYQQAILQAVNKPQTVIKNEGSIPAGHRAVRDQAGNIVSLEAIPGGPADPTRPTDKQRNDLVTASKTHSQLMQQLDEYERTLSGGIANLPGAERDKVKTQRTQIMMGLKNLYELGALNGPDQEILDKIIFDPTALSARGEQVLGAGDPSARAIANLQQIRAEAGRAMQAALGNNPGGALKIKAEQAGVSVEDLQFTAQKHGMSVDQVLQMLSGGQ